jgi:hypothetical protein
VRPSARSGLQAARAADLVHRDFKPDNVLLGSDARPRVADFGLARVGPLMQELAQRGADSNDSRASAAVTVAGAIMGTPRYMSPEQHMGAATAAPSDQFSFCVALYEALYGRLPFARETQTELSQSVRGDVVQPLPSPSPIPAQVGAALARGLQVDPSARFPSMAELLADLALSPHQDRRMEPGSKWVLVLGILALVSGSTLLSLMRWPTQPALVVRMYQVSVVQLAIAIGMLLVLHQRLKRRPCHWGFHAGSWIADTARADGCSALGLTARVSTCAGCWCLTCSRTPLAWQASRCSSCSGSGSELRCAAQPR